MLRYGLPIGLLVFTIPVFASNNVYELIDNKRYGELRDFLDKNESVNVISRASGGISMLDYAVMKKDQRASIMLAEYNNEMVERKKIENVKSLIDSLQSQIKDSLSIIEKLKGSDLKQRDLLILELKESNRRKEKQIASLQSFEEKNNDGKYLDITNQAVDVEHSLTNVKANIISILESQSYNEKRIQQLEKNTDFLLNNLMTNRELAESISDGIHSNTQPVIIYDNKADSQEIL